MDDLISRQTAICIASGYCHPTNIAKELAKLPSAQPERKRMTNKEWIDFLSEQFDISRTSAREMLHGMMRMRKVMMQKGGKNESD